MEDLRLLCFRRFFLNYFRVCRSPIPRSLDMTGALAFALIEYQCGFHVKENALERLRRLELSAQAIRVCKWSGLAAGKAICGYNGATIEITLFDGYSWVTRLIR